ncbi:pyridine nucleotide-disulfide oxidoreductase domain-containing protein 2 [Tyto alba]|uniref:pyridine nucleotide-disulfide oxidoreductase domain-containing protein 2 n=1 Tax=Tyto alba TaxID=56313 RepID=UPI001C684DA2|nr:pyridine nucleotide-disulfide oxidoreductase domain-containing protein 2 [Tyto alba]
MGPVPKDSGSRGPLSLYAAHWGWEWQFREHWTMVGPLPRPAGQEFALQSNSTGFKAKITPKAAPFPTALRTVLGACLRKVGPSTPCPTVLVGPSPQPHPTGFSLEHNRGWGALGPLPACPAASWRTGWGGTCHPAEHQAECSPVVFSALSQVSSSPASPQQSSARVNALLWAAPVGQCWVRAPVLPSLPASPGMQHPALRQGIPYSGPPPTPPRARKPWEKFRRESKVQAAGRRAAMAGHCGAMATGLRTRLGAGCLPRWLQGWRLSLRLAHAGAADRLQREYDAVVIGAGHNGLVAAAYLQRAGLRTAVLEKRHVLGGAAVTEEIVPGFKFSRASYLLSLLRPQIYAELELQQHGLRVLPRDPYSFTPLLEDRSPPRSLLLGHDMAQTQRQIAQFSQKDAQVYPEYEAFMGRLVSALDPLLDAPPVNTAALGQGSLLQQLRALQALRPLLRAGLALGRQLPRYYEVLTAPISKILDQWFESEPLKATLATDAVIGAMASPHTPGSGYVLLHHVMGELEGRRGAWGYVAGGMGALSQALANAAASRGAHIFAEKAVCHVLLGRDGRAQGIALQDGTEVRSKLVLSNASPQITFLELIPQEQLPEDFVQRIRQIDTRSPVTKINVAVDRLPSFLAAPNAHDGQPLPHHQCSIHLNCESTHLLHQAFTEATHGHPSSRPMIELCIPSALDPGLAPQGCHVVSLFTQYTPSVLVGGRPWDEQARNAYADTVFDCIEAYAPGFKASVIGRDILTPPDLERIFGLPGGNIFHGGMSLDQLYFARPAPSYSGYRSPISGLYLCGSGAHPGGGVMGAAGRNAAQVALEDFRRL